MVCFCVNPPPSGCSILCVEDGPSQEQLFLSSPASVYLLWCCIVLTLLFLTRTSDHRSCLHLNLLSNRINQLPGMHWNDGPTPAVWNQSNYWDVWNEESEQCSFCPRSVSYCSCQSAILSLVRSTQCDSSAQFLSGFSSATLKHVQIRAKLESPHSGIKPVMIITRPHQLSTFSSYTFAQEYKHWYRSLKKMRQALSKHEVKSF